MGGKSGISLPKIKAPRITIGKDLGMKNIGKVASNVVKATGKAGEDLGRGVSKGATTAYKTIGDTGSGIVKSVGKGVEGVVANQNDALAAMLKGDFKGMAGESLASLQSVKDMAKGLSKANANLYTGALKSVGDTTGSREISQTAENIKREGDKGVDKYGDAAIDVGANIATGGTYGLAKQAAQGLSTGGLGGMLSGRGLQDMAAGAIGSYAGVDPNMLKMGLSAAQGDLKGAALQGLGSFAGLSPDQMKMATTAASALTGDKKGIASGLASQFGAGDSVANTIGSVAGGSKNDIASALGSQLGLDPKMSSILGAVAGGDLKGAALSKLAGATGIPDDILKQVSTGKFDVGELAKNANLTASLGDTAKSYLPGSVSNMIDGAKSAGRVVESANAYKDDIQNQALDRAGVSRDQVKAIQDVQGAAESAYKVAKGDTLSAIAKRQGVSVEALMAANGIKDPNKIAAGMDLKMPGAISRSIASATSAAETGFTTVADKFMKDANGKTIMGANNAPILNPDYSSTAADARQAGVAAEANAPGLWDRAKDFVGGAVDSIKDTAVKNRDVVQAGIQGAGATAGYLAADASAAEQKKYADTQLAQAQGINELDKFKFDPRRDTAYTGALDYLQQVQQGGGLSKQQQAIQTEGDRRALKMSAANRMSGMRSLQEMGQGATGGGAGFASFLSGQQAESDIISQSTIEREKSAAAAEKDAYLKSPELLETKTGAERSLAGARSAEDIARVSAESTARANLSAIEQARADAKIKAITTGTDIASGLWDKQADAMEKEKAEKEAKEKAATQTTTTTPPPTSTTPPPPSPAKVAGAAQVAGVNPTKMPAPMADGSYGQGAGVLATPNADALNQKYTPAKQSGVEKLLSGKLPIQSNQIMSQVANIAQTAKNPQDALDAAKKKLEQEVKQKLEQEAKKKLEQAKASASKAVSGIVPGPIKNIFGLK